jgi:hypothetical protein
MPLRPEALVPLEGEMEILEGEVVLRREDDGRVVIETAPPRARMALEMLQHWDRFLVRVSGNTIRLAGQVAYRVVGWDAQQSALLLERQSPAVVQPESGSGADPPATFPPGAGTKGA